MSDPIRSPKAHWMNPCGVSGDRGPLQPPPLHPRPTHKQLEPLINASKHALNHARKFLNEWVGKTFHKKVDDHHSLWNRHLDWLPSRERIPKGFGESLSEQALYDISSRSLEHTLVDAYRVMQEYGEALEHSHQDQNNYGDRWAHHFKTMMDENRQVLCELESVLLERDPERQLGPPAPRERTSTQADEGSSVNRNIRDWFIIRDFTNALEYISQVCEFYANQSN